MIEKQGTKPIRVIDIQAQARRCGVIRLGAQQQGTGPGRRLNSFRLTSNDKRALEAASFLYGGAVMPWAGGSQQWQIITESNALPIEISNIPVTTQYETWAQVGGKGSKQCIRRCDGCTIVGGIEEGNPCRCPSDPLERLAAAKRGQACGLQVRMFVRLPELPDVGVWQVTSTSFYAAKEVPAIMDGIEHLASWGAHIRAELGIEIRTSGGKKFPVVCVRVPQSADQLQALAFEHIQKMKAIQSGGNPMAELAMKFGLDVVDGEVVEPMAYEAPALPARSAEEYGGGQGEMGGFFEEE